MSQYPVFAYVVPALVSRFDELTADRENEKHRQDRLRHVLRFILGVAAIQGEIVAPSKNIEAVAVWIRSDTMQLSAVEALRAGLLTLPFRIGVRTMKRLFRLAKTKELQRKKILTRRYYLLDMLGVVPELQHHGYGRLLIEAKLQEIDRERTLCYLETSNERNIGYYRRYGFELVHEHWIDTLPVYCLLRSEQG